MPPRFVCQVETMKRKGWGSEAVGIVVRWVYKGQLRDLLKSCEFAN